MKRKKISFEIRQAIRIWYRDGGLTQTEMGDLIGVSNPTVNSWINGKISSIRPEHWEKIYPHIKDYLHTDEKDRKDDAPANTHEDRLDLNSSDKLPPFVEKILLSDELSADEKVKVLLVFSNKNRTPCDDTPDVF